MSTLKFLTELGANPWQRMVLWQECSSLLPGNTLAALRHPCKPSDSFTQKHWWLYPPPPRNSVVALPWNTRSFTHPTPGNSLVVFPLTIPLPHPENLVALPYSTLAALPPPTPTKQLFTPLKLPWHYYTLESLMNPMIREVKSKLHDSDTIQKHVCDGKWNYDIPSCPHWNIHQFQSMDPTWVNFKYRPP